MTSEEFLLNYFLPHYNYYIYSIVIVALLFYFLFRKKVISIIDPLLLSIIAIAFADTIFVFLIFCNEISINHIVYVVLGQILFFSIYLYYIPNKKKYERCVRVKRDLIEIYLLYICIGIYIFSILYSYYLNGIPLFNDSRFEINIDNSSGILGLLNKFSSAVQLYIIINIFYTINFGRKLIGLTLLLVVLVFNFLSGAKGFIFSIASGYFFYKYYYEGKLPNVKIKYILLGLMTPLVTIVVMGLSSNGSSFMFLAYRILAYGDIYWNAYPNDIISSINYSSPLLNMCHLLIGPIRHLFDVGITEKLMQTGGTLIFEENYGYYPDKGAPNSPVFLMSWIYYRWNGLFLVIIQAWIGGFLFCRLKRTKRTLTNCCYKGLLVSISLSWSDVYLFYLKISYIIIFFFIVTLVKALAYRKKKVQMIEVNISNNFE